MAILMSLQGNSAGDGFLVKPLGTRTFDGIIELRTDAGTASVTLQASPNVAGLVFSQTALDLTTNPTFVAVHATAQSGAREDTTIQVLQGVTVVASLTVTSIEHPVVHFRGRFESRFPAGSVDYNTNPFYTAATPLSDGHPGGGWTWGLEGEPNFVPTTGNVPENLETPVGREIRFNNPVSLRSQASPVVTTVDAISGQTTSGTESFALGDPVIGQPVNVGPNTYFAGNQDINPADPRPEEFRADAQEILALFEIHVGNLLSGASQVGPFIDKATTENQLTRSPDSRPIGSGAPLASAEMAEIGLPTLLAFSEARIDALVTEYDGLASTSTPQGRNLARRIGHLLDAVGTAKRDDVQTTHPGEFFPQAVSQDFAWLRKMTFNGKVDANLQFQPGDSSVVEYLGQFSSFAVQCIMFSYHTDELCGYNKGKLTAELTSGFPDFTAGVYDAQTNSPGSFAAVTASGMTESAITALLGGSPTGERTAVTLSSDMTRLVVSRVTIVDDTLGPASWQIATQTDAWVCELIPEISTLYRDMVFLVLPPDHERNVLGACEGTAPTPPPTVGYARVWYDTGSSTWRYMLHAGIPGGTGSTQIGTYAGSSATKVAGCTQPELDLLSPIVDFGKVEQGMVLHRQILLFNRSASSVNVQLPSVAAPFGTPGATSVDIAPGTTGALLVSYAAGLAGSQESLMITLTSTPVVTGSLSVTLYGDPEDVAAVDVVLVLDRSGSMAGTAFSGVSGFSQTKAQLRNDAAQVFVDLLRPDDQVGMVRYNATTAVHMPIAPAGDGSAGTGKALATTALGSSDLNPTGATAIGSALVEGDTMLSTPSTNQKAMVVLTDGKENVTPYIDAVTLSAGADVYAVGIGTPDQINVEKLDTITGNTGGYLLLTGDMGATDEYRLQKYYTQILAGISGDQIVVDPRTVIGAGQVQRTTFYLSEADAHVDVVLLNIPQKLDFWLEAPDGSVIDPSSAGLNAEYIQGKKCVYYRLRAPVFPGDAARGYGGWNAVVRYPGDLGFQLRSGLSVARGDKRSLADLLDPVERLDAFRQAARDHRAIALASKEQASNVASYNVVVRARSSLTMDVRLVADSMGVTASRRIVASMMAFGMPYLEPVQLVAEITAPDGSVRFVTLQPTGDGTYGASVETAGRRGGYQIVVRAAGSAPGGMPLQREQTLSMPVIVPGSSDSPPPDTADLGSLKDAIDNLIAALTGGLASSFLFKWLPLVLLLLILILILVIWNIAT